MFGFLLTILVLDALFLGVVVLLQSGKGGGLAAMGGGAAATEGILGGRQATTVLTRSTWIAGTVFMVLALVLSIMSSRAQQSTSILQENVPPATQTAPEPVLPGAGQGGETGGGAEPAPVLPGGGSGGEAGGDAGGEG